jgi:hypothetical protein
MRKGPEVFTTSGTDPWSLVTQIFLNDQPSHVVCPFVLFIWPLCCLFFFDIRILIAPLFHMYVGYLLLALAICL